MRYIIFVLAIAAASLAGADTIRIRITHEGVGATNTTTRVISATNRVEMIKEWVAASGATNALDSHLADATEAQIVGAAREWKVNQLRLEKMRRIDAEVEGEVGQ